METTLENLQIAKPCSADWAAMSGDERVRHCGMCKLNVYNLSSMSRAEAEALIREKEGKLCVKLFKRPDGTVITQDCPVGLKRVRQRMAILAGGLAASIFFAAGSVLARMGVQTSTGSSPAQALKQWVKPDSIPVQPPTPNINMAMMGSVCVQVAPINTTTPVNPVPLPAPTKD